MAPTLEPVMTLHIVRTKDDALLLSSTKGGAIRGIQPLIGGYLKGKGFQAEYVQGGSDWVKFDAATGVGYLDARLQFRDLSSQRSFYVRFEGIVREDEKIQKVLEWSPEAKTTESKDHYHFSWPIFEVSNESDKWMEHTAFVAHGHYVVPGDGTQAVECEIYQLVTG